MSPRLTLITLMLASTMATGCLARIPFTQNLKDQYKLKKDEVKDLQFFISHLVMLERQMGASDRVVAENHKLVVRSGKKVEQIVILANTPGVVVNITDDEIHASFEQGSHLVFKANASQGGRYTLHCHKKTTMCVVQLITKNGPVEFNVVGDGEAAHLLIDKANMDKYQHKISVQKGRTL